MKQSNKDLLDPLALPNSNYPKSAAPLFQWKASIVISTILISFIAGWFSHADLFSIPKDVKQSRDLYFATRQELDRDPIYWQEQRLSFEEKMKQASLESNSHEMAHLIQTIQPHTIIDILSQGTSQSGTLAITPKRSGSSLVLIATKPERLFWPFSTMLSLEIELQPTTEGVSMRFTRLRRGSQEFSPTLARSYFGADLEMLKKSNLFLFSKTS